MPYGMHLEDPKRLLFYLSAKSVIYKLKRNPDTLFGVHFGALG